MAEVSAARAVALAPARNRLLLLFRCEADSRDPLRRRILQNQEWLGNRKSQIKLGISSSSSASVPPAAPVGQVSFDEYIQDRPRIFNAMFPDRRRSKRLNDEEWRIQMQPIQFLFASVRPVVVMRLRCKSQGQVYPPGVPPRTTRVLQLQATKWELHGLDSVHMPPDFCLNVRGALYAERQGRGSGRSRLKGHLHMSIRLVLPSVLTLVPEDILKGAAEAVLKRLVEKMKREVDVGLLSDFANFRKEKLITRNAKATSVVADNRDTNDSQ